MNTLEGQQEWCSVQENYRKKTPVVWPCDEDERGAHSGHSREKKKSEAKPMMARCV